MSGSVNKVILVGNLGADPETRRAGNDQVTNFNIATSEKWTDKQTGEVKERTEWHRIVTWGKLAELCAEYLAEGRKAYVEGNLQTRQWDDKDGIKRYTTEVRAREVVFLSPKDSPGGKKGFVSQAERAAKEQAAADENSAAIAPGGRLDGFNYGPPPTDTDDDKPF